MTISFATEALRGVIATLIFIVEPCLYKEGIITVTDLVWGEGIDNGG